jgi:hypothetical protein
MNPVLSCSFFHFDPSAFVFRKKLLIGRALRVYPALFVGFHFLVEMNLFLSCIRATPTDLLYPFVFVKNREKHETEVPTVMVKNKIATSLAIPTRRLAMFGEAIRFAILLFPRQIDPSGAPASQ